MNHLRAAWRKLASSETAYRGVTLELKPWEARPILEAVAKGATRLLADEFLRAMARGSAGINWMTGHPNGPQSTAGRWWTTDYKAAVQYAGGCSMSWAGKGEPGNIMFGVVMEAEIGHDVPGSEDISYNRWWHLEPGTPLTIHRFTVDVPTQRSAKELIAILDHQGAWDDVEGWFDATTWKNGEVEDTQEITLPIPPMKTEALPSWRPYQNDRTFWAEHDAVIATDKAGRRRTFEIWVEGKPFGRGQTLQEAKDRVEAKLGPLIWSIERLTPEVIGHYYWGQTGEFSDPLTIYWADR